MNRISFLRTVALGIVATGAALAAVKTDFDPTAHFEKYQTFAWRSPKNTNTIVQNSLLDQRLRNNVTKQMMDRGMREDPRKPDVYLVYHANAQPRREVSYYGGGWGWGWHRPYWGGPATVYTYVAGSVVLDMVDAHTNQLVWRAYMTNTGSHLADVQSDKHIHKMVSDAFKKYPVHVRKPS